MQSTIGYLLEDEVPIKETIIAIGGVPASGKTTLVRKLMQGLGKWEPYEHRLVKGHYNIEKNIYVIGIYNNDLFSGTDKLSMAVQPVFLDWVPTTNGATIIFEGDRLFNQSLFNKYRKTKIYVVEAMPDIIDQRRNDRATEQSIKFLKAKHTKILKVKHNNVYELLLNNKPIDIQDNVQTIIDYINNNKK